ncbi:MAG: hypothetical protein ABSH48_21385 [Verrucomicrobiota bacterium]|jgi:hypothetical protein
MEIATRAPATDLRAEDEKTADRELQQAHARAGKGGTTASAALRGFGIGVIGATAFMLLGGHYLPLPLGYIWVDHAALIVFYRFSDYEFYDLRMPLMAARVLGILNVGLMCGLLTCLARLVCAKARKGR